MSDEVPAPPRRLGDIDGLFARVERSVTAGREEMATASSTLRKQTRAIAAARASVQISMRAFERLRAEIVQSAELPHAHYRRQLRVLRLKNIALTLWLMLWRAALWIARMWQILWRYLLGLAIFLALAWVVSTYGPPAWSYVTGIVGDIAGRFVPGAPPADVTPAPAEAPASPTGAPGNG